VFKYVSIFNKVPKNIQEFIGVGLTNCALNKITIKNNYPLLRIENLLDQFNEAKYFSQIYLKLGYCQICIVDEDVEKTFMKTKYGLYI
jgi:hypothetical protein